MASLNDKCVCSDCSPTSPLLHGLSSSLRHAVLKLGQLITPQWPLSAQVKGKSHISLTLNEKLDTVKLTGEGRLKAKTESK